MRASNKFDSNGVARRSIKLLEILQGSIKTRTRGKLALQP